MADFIPIRPLDGADRIGPDLDVPAGLVARLFLAGPLVKNEDGTGYTGRTPCGGVVILSFDESGFEKARKKAAKSMRAGISDAILSSARKALTEWALDPEFRSRGFWAEKHGITSHRLAKLCDENPDRNPPVLRGEYEKARMIRKGRRNARRNLRRDAA